jgi:RNA polymerase sigma factor (sigma-70 family)
MLITSAPYRHQISSGSTLTQELATMEIITTPLVNGLSLLIARLDIGKCSPADSYDRLVNALTTFCETKLRYPSHADEIVRKIIDIISLKLNEGIDILDLRAYGFAVAKHLLSDYRRKVVPEYLDDTAVIIETYGAQATSDYALKAEIDNECRLKCLQRLPPGQQDLLVRYYRGGLHCKDERENIAKDLDITPEALCNRIARIRKKLLRWRSEYSEDTKEFVMNDIMQPLL